MSLQNMLLMLATIALEVTATLALKWSQGLSRLIPSVIVLVGYASSFFLLSILLKRGVPIGLVYAIWSGLGTVGVVLAGALIWQEKVNLWAALGILLVIGGVALINLNAGAH